jgi:hypothetical protein
MWEHVTRLHQPTTHTLYISTLELAGSIRYNSFVDSYRQLTEPAYYWVCDCCHLCQVHDSVLHLHEFLRRLRAEFEQLQARSPLSKAAILVRAKEIRLRGVLFSSATVLAASTALTNSTPAPTTSSMPPSAPTGALGPVTGTATTLFCRYCKAKTHEIE